MSFIEALGITAAWLVSGAIVLALLDRTGAWGEWYARCPSRVVAFLILLLWPLLAAVILIHWRRVQ